MSEVAIRNSNNAVDLHPAQDHAIARLAEWAQAADAAYTMARKLVSTQFVPQQYRGKPEEATAAILAGAEVGLSPMAALRAFDNIQGTPAPKAITLRAIVQGMGHDIRVVESTATRAVVTGLRAGEPEGKRQTSEWTIERAQQAGYVSKNPNYKSKPADMLVARATSEMCRWIASDAIMGMPYSAEEIRDEGPAFDAGTAPPRVTAAEILGIRAEPDFDEPAAVSSFDPDDPAPVSGPPAPDSPNGPPRATDAQQRKMSALFREVDVTDRDVRLRYVGEVLGRDVGSSKELTRQEATRVIDALESWAQAEQPPAGEQS